MSNGTHGGNDHTAGEQINNIKNGGDDSFRDEDNGKGSEHTESTTKTEKVEKTESDNEGPKVNEGGLRNTEAKDQ